MGHMTQQGSMGNLFSGSNNYRNDNRIDGMQSHVSTLIRGGGQLQQDHPLIQYVKQNADTQDPQQATVYTAGSRNDE